jgi:hypothetical protein
MTSTVYFFMHFVLRTHYCGFGVEPITLDHKNFLCFEPFSYSCLFYFLGANVSHSVHHRVLQFSIYFVSP